VANTQRDYIKRQLDIDEENARVRKMAHAATRRNQMQFENSLYGITTTVKGNPDLRKHGDMDPELKELARQETLKRVPPR
jgi:hypothetical protein